MNAPDRFLTTTVGEAEIRVPREAAVLAYLEKLLEQRRTFDLVSRPGMRVAFAKDMLPGIGEPFSNTNLEEVYAGITLHDGEPHALVLLPGDFEGTWQQAIDWAIGTGGVLPSRMDALVLWQNVRSHFKKEAYWTVEPDADDASYAWCQGFDWGGQSICSKDNELRARAVRREPI